MQNRLFDLGFFKFIMLFLLLIISAIDIKHQKIDIRLLLFLLAGGILSILAGEVKALSAIGAAMLVFSLLGIIYYVSKKSLGWGDVLLCGTTALYLGIEKSLEMLTAAMLICGVAGLILMIVKKSPKHSQIPFAPFILIGTIMTLRA